MGNIQNIDRLRQDIIYAAQLPGGQLDFHSTWGLFSPRAVDEGSRLLLEHLQTEPDDVVVDLGCGYGVLGLAIARLCPNGSVHLIDKDFVAVEYAQLNARNNGLGNTEIYLSNGLVAVPADLPVTLVVSNLPAKVGNELYHIAFHDAYQRMQPGARIVVVTINGLRHFIKRAFSDKFGNYTKLKQGKSYTVSLAVKQ